MSLSERVAEKRKQQKQVLFGYLDAFVRCIAGGVIFFMLLVCAGVA